MRRNLIRFITALFFVFNLSFGEDKELFDKVVLVINSEPVLKSDVEFAKQWYNVKTEQEAEEKIIDSILLYEQALKVGISARPAEVEEAILNIAKANSINSLDEFKKKLSEENIPYEKVKEFIKRDMVANRFLHFYLRQTLSKGVIEGELQDVRKVRIIFLSKDREDYTSTVKDVEKNITKENFQNLARQYSDDKFTAESGGLLGEVKKGELLKELDESVFSHKTGDIFKVETDKGTYFVYVENQEKKLLPREDFQQKSLEKFQREYDIYLKKLREQAVIQRL